MPKATTPKRYAVTLDPNDTGKGMKLVSLVKVPAIGAGWVALAAAEQPVAKRVHLSEAAEGPAKQVLTGPLLIPELDILRIDPETNEEFYISFSAEQIEAIAHRFMSQGSGLTLSNADHADPLEGNTIRELWFVRDSERDPAAVLGIDVPAGTLMASMHIADSDFWEKEVKTGNKTGFSIEGLFDFSELKLQAAGAAPKKPMSFLAKLQAALLAAFTTTVALASVELKDGTALEVDEATGAVFQMKDDGTRGDAQPDGTYELKDGAEFIVTDGKHVGHTVNDSDTSKAALGKDGAATAPAADAPKPGAADAKADEDPNTEKRLKALEDGLDKVLKAVTKDAKDDAPAGETAMSAAARARAEKDPVKLAAIELALEAVEMADGTSFSYNPITRRLLDSTGKMVESGQYACADGSYFKVNTEQYTYQIDKESYDKGVQLSAVEAENVRLMATTPAGRRLAMGAAAAATSEDDLAAMSPGKRRLALAKQAAASEAQ